LAVARVGACGPGAHTRRHGGNAGNLAHAAAHRGTPARDAAVERL
jgi:hypothetical protein